MDGFIISSSSLYELYTLSFMGQRVNRFSAESLITYISPKHLNNVLNFLMSGA